MRLTKILRAFSPEIAKTCQKYGNFRPTPLNLHKLNSFMKTGKEKESFAFLRTELCVRLANIMKEIDLLPNKLMNSPSGKLVKEIYEKNFTDLLVFEHVKDNDPEIHKQFTTTLADIYRRNHTNVDILSEGVIEMKLVHGIDQSTNQQLNYFLDRYYISRMSIRLLINQHVKMFGRHIKSDHVPIKEFGFNCDVIEVINQAYDNAKFLCEHYYNKAPDMKLILHNDMKEVKMVYVASHLHHIVFEILKNSMRAIVENTKSDLKNFPIITLVAKGSEDFTIKISDQGGGIERSHMPDVFNYTFTTAVSNISAIDSFNNSDGQAAMAGYGYGLPLSRLYARYLNGDLIMTSIHGYGTDTYIYLKIDAEDTDEMLPVFGATSTRKHVHQIDMHTDWSR